MSSNDKDLYAGSDPGSDRRRRIQDQLDRHPRSYDPWTDDERNRVLDLAKQGLDWADISEILGRSQGAVRSGAFRMAFIEFYGAELPGDRPALRDDEPWAEDDERNLIGFIEARLSWPEIGLELKRTPKACKRRAEQIALRRVVAGSRQRF